MKLSNEEILKKLKTIMGTWKDLKNLIITLDLTKKQFEKLTKYKAESVRWGLAHHPDLPKDLMYVLAKDDCVDVRKVIAGRSDLPKDLIYKLLFENDNLVIHEKILKNPNLSTELMYKIVKKGNWYQKAEIAHHPNLPTDLMYDLSEDKNVWVRLEVIENPNLPKSLIIKLSCGVDGAFRKLRKLNTIKLEDLESAYDLINNSKHIGRENFKETFDFIINKFPELNELAKMFKRIILKGKKDLK